MAVKGVTLLLVALTHIMFTGNSFDDNANTKPFTISSMVNCIRINFNLVYQSMRHPLVDRVFWTCGLFITCCRRWMKKVKERNN